MNDIIFDYYRGVEAEQYSFYRIPKMLFTDTIFQDLSCEAKVLLRSNVRPYEFKPKKSLDG